MAREKESRLEQQNVKLNCDLDAATARCQELEAENERMRYLLVRNHLDLFFVCSCDMHCRLAGLFDVCACSSECGFSSGVYRFACWTCRSQEKAVLETQVATMTQRQKESDINEEHLNEKLKAITEKCQAVLVHNSKLQEQVSGRYGLRMRIYLSRFIHAPLFDTCMETPQVNKSKAEGKASGSNAPSKNSGAQI